MKILAIAILLALIINLPALAQDANGDPYYAHKEYAGFMVYESTDKKGDKVLVTKPVTYKISPSSTTEDNDEHYKYRNYRIEMERSDNEKEIKNKAELETKKINSAAYYPLYFD